MKNLIKVIFIIIIVNSAYSQNYWKVNNNELKPINEQYFLDSTYLQNITTRVYAGNGVSVVPQGKGYKVSNALDTTSLSNRINLKLNIVDTTILNAEILARLKYSDTTNLHALKLANKINVVDSTKIVAGSNVTVVYSGHQATISASGGGSADSDFVTVTADTVFAKYITSKNVDKNFSGYVKLDSSGYFFLGVKDTGSYSTTEPFLSMINRTEYDLHGGNLGVTLGYPTGHGAQLFLSGYDASGALQLQSYGSGGYATLLMNNADVNFESGGNSILSFSNGSGASHIEMGDLSNNSNSTKFILDDATQTFKFQSGGSDLFIIDGASNFIDMKPTTIKLANGVIVAGDDVTFFGHHGVSATMHYYDNNFDYSLDNHLIGKFTTDGGGHNIVSFGDLDNAQNGTQFILNDATLSASFINITKINMASLPTSNSGLSSGDLWKDNSFGGDYVLRVVP